MTWPDIKAEWGNWGWDVLSWDRIDSSRIVKSHPPGPQSQRVGQVWYYWDMAVFTDPRILARLQICLKAAGRCDFRLKVHDPHVDNPSAADNDKFGKVLIYETLAASSCEVEDVSVYERLRSKLDKGLWIELSMAGGGMVLRTTRNGRTCDEVVGTPSEWSGLAEAARDWLRHGPEGLLVRLAMMDD